MKTKEFVTSVEALGFGVLRGKRNSYVTNKERTLCSISEDGQFEVDTYRTNFANLEKDTQAKLFKLVTEYSATPIEERKEEKKYRYELPALDSNDNFVYLHKHSINEVRIGYLCNQHIFTEGVYEFTDKEVKQYTDKARALFDACEKIEITEDK